MEGEAGERNEEDERTSLDWIGEDVGRKGEFHYQEAYCNYKLWQKKMISHIPSLPSILTVPTVILLLGLPPLAASDALSKEARIIR